MNWGGLKNLATTFLHRKDIDFDALQSLLCDDISLVLVVQENESQASMTLAQSTSQLWFAPLPINYASMRHVAIAGATCNPRDIKTLNEKGYSGRAWYSVSDMQLFAWMSGQADITYTVRCELLTDDNQTNIVLNRYSPIYLYSLLKHSAVVCQDYDARDEYERLFIEAVDTANRRYMDFAFGPGAQAVPVGGMV